MAISLKKSVMGYVEAKPGDRTDFIGLEKYEYNRLLEKDDVITSLRRKEKGYVTKNADLEKQLAELREKYRQLLAEHQKYVDAVNAHKELILETRQHKKTIEDVIEIVRERANKERKLKPKKEHIGYVILSTEQIEYKHGKYYYTMWKSKVQTPFFSEMEYKDMLNLIKNDEQWKEFLRSSNIGATGTDNFSFDYENNKPFMEESNFKRNIIGGYWEITIIHNMEVVI